MKNLNNDINKLIAKATLFLDAELHYSEKTIYLYQIGWNYVRQFMFERDLVKYDKSIEQAVLRLKFKNKSLSSLTKTERYWYYGIKALIELQDTGKIKLPPKPPSKEYVFDGPIGTLITEFIEYRSSIVSVQVIRKHRQVLFEFLQFAKKNKIKEVKDIQISTLLKFFRITKMERTMKAVFANCLRIFTKYLFEEGLISKNIGLLIPKFKRTPNSKLPQTYSPGELKQLLKSIDRASPTAKRNYAIVQLLVQFGLRPSDVTELNINNINWDSDKIVFNHAKNGELNVKPLIPEVGNAIMDYLKNGRPESDDCHVFLAHRPPKLSLSSNAISSIVARTFRASNIDPTGRTVRPRVFRYSYASRLEKANVPYHLIAKGLGHKGTTSVKGYTPIENEDLKVCCLEVSPVAFSFYKNQIDTFYGKEI